MAQEDPALHLKKETKASRFGEYKGYSTVMYRSKARQSIYLTMRDGIRIAIDVYLPSSPAPVEKIPAILYLTRYIRSLQPKGFVRWLKNPVFGQISQKEIDFFTSHGYACILADARGSGASFGSRQMDFSAEEIADAAEIMDWIVSQPWSNGNIGTTGISYVGTTAELMIINRHPAHKAAIPRSAIFDLYEDMAYPGGVCETEFLKVWGKTTAALDRGQFKNISKQARLFIRGASPVKSDRKGILRDSALHGHAGNYEVAAELEKVENRGDIHPQIGKAIDEFSVHNHLSQIAGAHTRIMRIGGYYDGALGLSMLKGLLNTPNTDRVILGPWDHGPKFYASPYAPYKEVRFHILEEMLRFFDFNLKNIANGVDKEPRIHYFTMGTERWDTTSVWPPPGIRTTPVYVGSNRSLLWSQSADTGSVTHTIDYTFGSGNGSRWNSLMPQFRYADYTNYENWKERTATNAVFRSAPLFSALEICGQIEADVLLRADARDGALYVYAEEEDSSGHVRYITEGQIRLKHRKEAPESLYKSTGIAHSYRSEDAEAVPPGQPIRVRLSLLPTTYRIKPGSRLRISFSGHDAGHTSIIQPQAHRYDIQWGGPYGSRILLPILERR